MNNKKKIKKLKTKQFLAEFPIIFVLQQNNFTVNDWLNFRSKIQEIEQTFEISQQLSNSVEMCPNIALLNVKNSLLKNILEFSHIHSKLNQEFLSSTLQGPNFIIGCKNENHLNFIWNSINSNSKLLFISCLYKNQLLNHLDLEILLKTNSSIYQTFLTGLDKKTEFCNIFQESLTFYPLLQVQSNLITVLSLIKERF